MPFIKGDARINKSGRPKGSKNKSSSEIKRQFAEIIHNNIEQINDDLKTLTPSERIKFILELCKFLIPTLRASEVDANINNTMFQPLEIIMNDINNENENQ